MRYNRMKCIIDELPVLIAKLESSTGPAESEAIEHKIHARVKELTELTEHYKPPATTKI